MELLLVCTRDLVKAAVTATDHEFVLINCIYKMLYHVLGVSLLQICHMTQAVYIM